MRPPLLLIAASFLLAGCATPPVSVTDKLVNTGFKPGRSVRVDGELVTPPIDTIVIHFSSNAVANPKHPYDVDAVIKTYAPNASAHYLIDRAGRIYRLVRETDTAYHAGKGTWRGRTDTLNAYSIGIEIMAIGTKEDMATMLNDVQYSKVSPQDIGYTDEEYVALNSLIRDIEARHPAIKHDRLHILGHQDYAPGRKHDPGTLFDWGRIGL